ncbi:uncharacterized protein DEA37_0014123 [Paragonimus westermani]|uniref:Phosphatidylserine Lipase ABHD16 N-terminal domain-containing protein n=1 Tax=Paragonimus westermani TaxID=34504 RepID=A0A5J4N5C9_9TREM|nr:uncharacterized protein DEA37_0014123 [Paragonimus westermani]
MSSAIRSFWFAVKGPTIYRVPVGDATLTESANYRPNLLEHIPTVIIQTTDGIYTLLKWTVLLWSPWLLFNGMVEFFRTFLVHIHLYISAQNRRHLWSCVYLTGYLSAVYGAAFLIRGAGRLLNSNYCQFLNLYRLALHDKANEHALERLTFYGFSSPWPAQFDVRQLPEAVCIQKKPTPSRSANLPTIFWPLTSVSVLLNVVQYLTHHLSVCIYLEFVIMRDVEKYTIRQMCDTCLSDSRSSCLIGINVLPTEGQL